MILRPFFVDATSCASYVFGCTSHHELAVVDPHVDLVDRYVEAERHIEGDMARRRIRP